MTTEIDELKKDISALTKTLILTSIILATLFILTGCSWLSANPHTDVLMIPPSTITEE